MKFNENHSTESGNMERTQNSRVNPMTLSLCSLVDGSAHCLTERIIMGEV